MVQKLPYSRVIDVTVTRQDRFATAQGFSVINILGIESKAGVLDSAIRTKVYGSMTEVAVDWAATSEFHKAAQRIFQRNPSPRQIKLSFRDAEKNILDELDAIYAYDADWYWLTHTKELADKPDQLKVADWAEAHNVLFGGDTFAVKTEDKAARGTDCFASYIRDKNYTRSAAFYHVDPDAYFAASALAYCARRDLDQANFDRAMQGDLDSGQAYTLKFKGCPGIATLNKDSGAVQAVTGFVPGLGLDPAQGNLANAYVNVGGVDMIVEGNVGSGEFIDVIHSLDWLRARVQEAMLSTLANNPRVPMTNPGVAFLINGGVRPPLNRAVAAGIIAGDMVDGQYMPEYEIAAERVENIPASQRHQRIAPDIQVKTRLAGAIHYASCNIIVSF